MGFWKSIRRLFSRETSASASVGPRSGGSFIDMPGSMGTVSLNIATVYRCVSLLSESVANLPLQYLVSRGGVFAEDKKSDYHYLLNVQPDTAYSAFDFWTKVVQDMLLRGNAYIVPFYTSSSVPYRLALCSPGSVVHDTLNDVYHVNDVNNAVYGDFAEDEIIHIKNMTFDGKKGLSTLAYARMTLGIASAGDKETYNRFSSGGNVRGLVCNDTSVRGYGEYADDQLEKTAERLNEVYLGSQERFISVPGQVELKTFSLSSTDMQFLESRKFTVREICRFFGVHPSFVFDDTSNNYKSAEMANVAFLSNTLNPILRKIENELERKLMSRALSGKCLFHFDRRGIYAADLESRTDYQTKALAAGIYTVNELRAQENLAPVEGGDRTFVSANLRDIKETSQNNNNNQL